MKWDKFYVWLKNLKEEGTLGRSAVGGIITYERK
jgi:hypothetical protein